MSKTQPKKDGSSEVAEASKKTTAVAVVDSSMFEADAGVGLEGADRDSFAIPFLTVLQGLSPQLETVEGAKPGMLLNTVTNELYNAVTVVPVAFQRRFLRWTPRDEGGGFKGELQVSEVDALIAAGKAVKDDEGKLKYDGDILKDTRNHYVFIVKEDGSFAPAVMSLSSTQIKRSKRWMSQINSLQMTSASGVKFTPPSFSHMYKASSVKEENDKGKWHSFQIDLGGPVTDAALYNAAKEFHKQVVSGNVKVQPPQDDAEGGSEAAAEGGF